MLVSLLYALYHEDSNNMFDRACICEPITVYINITNSIILNTIDCIEMSHIN